MVLLRYNVVVFMFNVELTRKIIGSAIEVHKVLGPGLLESAYLAAMQYELKAAGLWVRAQVPMPLVYKGQVQEVGFRLDLLVEEEVIVELKAVEHLAPVHFAQVLTYLRLSDKKLALLMNFNTKYLKNGIHRIVNNY